MTVAHGLLIAGKVLGLSILAGWTLQTILTIACAIAAAILAREPLRAWTWCGAWMLAATASYAGAIVGVPIVAMLAFFKVWTLAQNPLGQWITAWRPRWAHPWSNMEDGVIPPLTVNGQAYMHGSSDRWRAFIWCAFRNKVSNLRFTRPFGFRVDPPIVRSASTAANLYRAGSGWSVTWQRGYCGLWVRWPSGMQVRMGWTLVPEDALGFNPLDLRQLWCGFSIQFN